MEKLVEVWENVCAVHLWHVACLPYLGARLKLHGCSLLFDGLIGLGTPVCAV